MAVGDVWQLQLHQSYASQRLMNTLHFDIKTESGPTQAQAQALAQDWADFLGMMQNNALTHTGWVLQQVRGSDVTYPQGLCRRLGGMRYDGVYPTTPTGDSPGDGLPPQCAQVVTFKTNFAGRSKRGRIYVSGVSESGQANGIVSPASVTGNEGIWATQAAQFIDDGTDPVFRLGIWSNTIATGCKPSQQHPHPLVSGAQPAPQLAYTEVTSVQVRNIIYTQRRRTIGVGS